MSELKKIIEEAFENRDQINTQTKGEVRDSVDETLNQLDAGLIRVCEKNDTNWIVNQWIKKAILLSFRLNDNEIIKASHATWFDKVPSKTAVLLGTLSNQVACDALIISLSFNLKLNKIAFLIH